MKKILTLLTFLILATNIAYAADNTCSDHSGINCNVEPETPGNVVCNDGWVLSDPSFSFVDECKNVQTNINPKISSIHTTVSLMPNTSIPKEQFSIIKQIFVNPVVRVWHWLVQVF